MHPHPPIAVAMGPSLSRSAGEGLIRRVAIAVAAEILDNRGPFYATNPLANLRKSAGRGHTIEPGRCCQNAACLRLDRRSPGVSLAPQCLNDRLVDAADQDFSHRVIVTDYKVRSNRGHAGLLWRR